MKISIRTKITFMVVTFSLAIVAISWVVCNFIVEKVFVVNTKNSLKTVYESCDDLFSQEEDGSFNNGDLYGYINNPTGAIVLIFDRENKKTYTSINDESTMIESMNRTISSMETDFSYEPGTYEIHKDHDGVTNEDYYDLFGTLSNGNIIIIRTPVASVESSMYIVTRMFNGIALALMIFGSLFMLTFSNIFAAPIKSLSNAAKRMSMLDFDVKVPVNTHDEIGELGACMNEMSERLESTISELKSANLELEKDIQEKRKIDEMRKEFLSHVSHDLKTPIALIQGYAEGLKDNLDDDPESREFYTDVIIDEARKMNIMVKKLLTLNEIEFGTTPLSIERFELVQFIRDIISSSQILIENSNTEVVFEENEKVDVWADEYMIEEVFTNYLTNALHYVREGGIIKVYFERKEDNVRVNVYNQGDCIADEDIDKLFIKFYKANKARTREYGGNGIGLSIVAAIMQAHNREYGVKNVEDGVVFYFDLDANMLADTKK